jgi:hypothetical protein
LTGQLKNLIPLQSLSLRRILLATISLDATRTSRLKAKWLEGDIRYRIGHHLFLYVPLNTIYTRNTDALDATVDNISRPRVWNHGLFNYIVTACIAMSLHLLGCSRNFVN